MAWLAAVATLASVGYSAYSASQQQTYTPSTTGSREVSDAQARMLPIQRALAAAEQSGGKVDLPPELLGTHSEQQQFVKVPVGPKNKHGQGYEEVPYVASEWESGGKYNPNGGIDPLIYNKAVDVPDKSSLDFAGYGTADIEGKLARQNADTAIALGEKYGVDFAKEATKEAEQADPEGTAARKMEYQLIQDQINKPKPVNPLSTGLESQIDSQLKAGSGLDPMSRDLLEQAVAKSNAARGDRSNAGDIAQSMSTGMEGQARREAGATKSQGFLSSGTSPADIEYRRSQQNLANLGAFTSGQTPESQFSNLSGAGQGAAPQVNGQQLPSMPNNASQVGGQYGVQAYQAQLNQAQNGTSPWLAGLSTLLSGVSSAAKSGGG